jgi:hypothetical protein
MTQGENKTTGWPNPDAPGVPLHPERDGWHWIVGWSDKLFVAEWDSDEKDYVWFDGGDDSSGIVENGWTYAGPVLTPSEADTLRAESARLRHLMRETVKWWDWWQANPTDHCASLPDDRINDMREALEEKP